MLARLKGQAQLCWLSAAQKAGPGAAQQFLGKASVLVAVDGDARWHTCSDSSIVGIVPAKPLHPRSRPKGSGCKYWCLAGASIGDSTCRPGTKRLADQNGSTEFQGVLLEDYSSSSQRGDPEVEAARYPAPGETGCFFRGRAFPRNIYLSPFPSRFKRREYNLRIVQLQTSASAVVLVH